MKTAADVMRFGETPEGPGTTQIVAEKRPHKLLVVEDDPVLVGIYQEVFTTGFEVLIASTCECAFKHMQCAKDIDLVILDYRLPDMCGTEVLKEVKKTMPSVPVIITTGFGDEEIAIESFRRGARDYLKKPFAIDELQKRVQFCLSLKSRGENGREGRSLEAVNECHLELGIRRDAAAASNIKKIQKAKLFIDTHYASAISQSAVAQYACLSTRHFCRLFKKVTGRTFQEYVKNLRIEKAKELLMNNHRDSITDVAHDVGYADLTHFERDFKKLTDFSPKYYRTMHFDPEMAE